ncbi:MAG: hypothetical protein HOE80_02215 [Candidatus Magasanikbacteria bacterium]|jgi:hypothetical protein|nr:hypothetical protein [Candidatus Magasanikbacteria bacterium]MBT4071514.1 hypothetical protein [Candidatus Magasanikbacteria bacterium]
MESLTIQNIICLLNEWQTLAGALIGALLPMVIALLIYPIQKYKEKKQQQKETLCRIEVYTSQVMNDMGDTLKDWLGFIDRIKDESTRKPDKQIGIFLTNTPLSVPVLYDKKLIQEKTYDIVLHNFLLNMGKWVRGFNALLNEKYRSYSELQTETQSQISHARALKDSNPGEIMENYRQMLAKYSEATEKSLCMSIRNGIEVTTIVKESANTALKSSFGFKRWVYRLTKKYRSYKKLKKLSIDDYSSFQDAVSLHFQNTFLKNLKLYLQISREQKMHFINTKNGNADNNNNYETKIEKEVLSLFSITNKEKELL